MKSGNDWESNLVRLLKDMSGRAFERASLPAWDAKWHTLSAEARQSYLKEAKVPSAPQRHFNIRSDPTLERGGVPPEKYPPEALKSLVAAGFLESRKIAVSKKLTERTFVPMNVRDFLIRIRSLERDHLLSPGPPKSVISYTNLTFDRGHLTRTLLNVLKTSQVADLYLSPDKVISQYVTSSHWPEWVLNTLGIPLAGKVLETLKASQAPIPITELATRVGQGTSEQVRQVLDVLIGHLAVFEDLQAETRDIVVGLLPVVHERLSQASNPQRRPPLSACKSPREEGPDGSPWLDDLRSFLLELATQPPRLRQDGELFQKEVDRFDTIFDPRPDWLTDALEWHEEGRLDQARLLAFRLGLVATVIEEKQVWLQLSPQGKEWLGANVGALYRRLYEGYNKIQSGYGYHDSDPYDDDLYDDDDFDNNSSFYYYDSGEGDSGFYGFNFSSRRITRTAKGVVARRKVGELKTQIKDLRDAIHSAFSALKLGTFYPIENVVEHLVFEQNNPLLLGLEPRQVSVQVRSRQIPSLMDFLETAGREALKTFIRERLIPLGCVQTAIDEAGRLCIARLPRLDAYFGQEVSEDKLVGKPAGQARVVVQP
ncbi:hypothetical protein ACYOEI_25220, partial [Singulisphaera rosea]